MKRIYEGILGSFDNEPKGFSSRKLTAFILILMVVMVHIKWMVLGDFSQLEMVLTIDYAFIASLFGMTTYSSMKAKEKTKPTEESVGETTNNELENKDK